MSNEIKEILNDLKNKDISVDDLTHNDKVKLLDYINSLQEENENLKDFNKKLQATKDRLDKYDKENQLKGEE